MNNNTMIQILLGFLLTSALAMGGWSLKQHFTTNAELAKMTVILERIQDDTVWREQKDDVDSKHWKYLSWMKKHIHQIYVNQGKNLPDDPNLD